MDKVADFFVGSLAGMGASFFTNCFDVVRTRMQLQGELKAKGKYKVHYKNIPHAMYNIAKNDGILALQRGVVPSVLFQLIGSGIRLGVYSQADRAGFLRDEKKRTIFLNALVVGGFSGAVGAGVGNPLLLVKTQIMSAASGKIAVGEQHSHTGTFSALIKIYKENGIAKGLWRGTYGQMLRNGVGSATQIASFSVIKDLIDANPRFEKSNRYLRAFMASNIGAIVKTLAMTPFDVIITRLYNQPLHPDGKGRLYSGVVDCARKTIATEGAFALYKGIGPSYFRQGPHSVLMLMFWDTLKDIEARLMETNEKGKKKTLANKERR